MSTALSFAVLTKLNEALLNKRTLKFCRLAASLAASAYSIIQSLSTAQVYRHAAHTGRHIQFVEAASQLPPVLSSSACYEGFVLVTSSFILRGIHWILQEAVLSQRYLRQRCGAEPYLQFVYIFTHATNSTTLFTLNYQVTRSPRICFADFVEVPIVTWRRRTYLNDNCFNFSARK